MADLDDLVGQSPAMESVRQQLRRILTLVRERARLPAILIEGETGTGKGLVASLLHRLSARASRPFVDLNCAAIPDTLLEGELFGYERGAFTDARRAKVGLFQSSSSGTLFLDEVGLLPANVQAKLLTAIDEKAVRRLGSTTKESFDSWIVSATNMDLRSAVRDGRFREDLYHRIAVLTVNLPPLRERAADAVLLAQRFLERACREYGLPVKLLTADARALVMRGRWPGNVRELGNVMERLALLVDGDEVNAAALEGALQGDRVTISTGAETAIGEREQIVAALDATGWNIMRTAARLGVSRNTVRARMDRWGLRRGREAASADPAPAGMSREAGPIAPPPTALIAATTIGAVRWERRHVTVLRVTLVGSVDVSLEAGRLLSQVGEKVLGFGGRTEALGRVSLDASFGVVLIENATRRAVSAALAIKKVVQENGRSDIGVTVVLHTGQATIGYTADATMIDEADRSTFASTLSGLTEHAGAGGGVHVSPATARFVEKHFELRPNEAPGAVPPWSFAVLGRDPSRDGSVSTLTPLVDRAAELDLLRSRWDVARQGRGQVVGVVGEAGVGKSRLLLEFIRTIDHESARVLRVAMSPADDPSRGRPAASLLRLMFGVEPGDFEAEIRDTLVARLRTLALEESLLAPLGALLEIEIGDPEWTRLEPSQRARRMLDALRRVIIRESLASPLAIVLEDLHWIDPDTQVAIESLMNAVPSAHVMLMLAYRPEYRHGWAGRTFYTQLRVDPLPAGFAGYLLDHLLGQAAELAPLKRQLTTWTEGNPFFLEECVRTLSETGNLAGVAGAFDLVAEVSDHTLPATVEETLAGRIHRLPADARRVLQCAAAIGIDFADSVLAAVVDLTPDGLDRGLQMLEDSEFLYPAGAAVEPGHTFKHALTHLVAYRSLPEASQRVLHTRILAVLEGAPTDQPDAHVEALAEHAVRGEMWSKAALYLRQAGSRALARSANRTAASYFERAIDALERTPGAPSMADLAVDLRLDLRHALTPLGEVKRILRHLRDAEIVAERVGDRTRLGRVVSFQTNCLFSLGDHVAAIDSGRRALAIARDLEDIPMGITAEQFIGRSLHARGNYRAAMEIFRRLIASLTGEKATQNLGLPVPPAIFGRSHLVWCLSEMGEFEEASRIGDETVRLVEATGQPEALQWACYPLGLLALDRGDLTTAMTLLERVLEVCRVAELPVYVPRASAALGHTKVLLDHPDGLAMLEQAVLEADRKAQVNVHSGALVRLADSYLHLRHVEKAVSAAERAVELSRKGGQRGAEVRALRVLASCARSASPPRLADAERWYREALELGEELEMRPQVARCHLGLGAVLALAGRTDEAREVLRVAKAEAGLLQMRAAREEAEAQLTSLG